MNHNKVFTFTCALAIAMAPLASEAATRTDGLNACADALVNKLSVDNGAPLSFQLDAGSENSNAQMSKREHYHLDVRDPNTHEVVARAQCVVDRQARVRQLVSVPLSADDAAERVLSF